MKEWVWSFLESVARMVCEPPSISSSTTDHVLLFGYMVHWWSPIGKHSLEWYRQTQLGQSCLMLVAIAGGGYSTLQVCMTMQWGGHMCESLHVCFCSVCVPGCVSPWMMVWSSWRTCQMHEVMPRYMKGSSSEKSTSFWEWVKVWVECDQLQRSVVGVSCCSSKMFGLAHLLTTFLSHILNHLDLHAFHDIADK